VPPCLRGFVLVAAVGCAACAPKLMKLPTGTGAPAPDVRDAVVEATTACQSVRSMSAEVGVSGSVGKQGLRGRLLIGVASPDSARIEAVAPFGQPVFILVAKSGDATLLLPRDQRILEHGKPADVLEAVAGIPLDAMDLRRALVGCGAALDGDAGRAIGDDWRVVPDGPDEAYLHRDARSGPWRIVAIVHKRKDGPAWRAEYKDFANGLPRSVRFAGPEFDLRLALSQVDLNLALGDEVFRVQVPRSADPITLDELKRARPGVRKD
jgi:hypothetical protein